ncbi:hypothetical protein [Flavobacterium dankookense]|uniref:RGS domain-containing protein n=1 Tax=Flavobacterium dankookense TaxID=706186 RepID=A0A4R6QG52_9FLAO|nr:hypothetical protein [Flavobacterium dankookense]TDP61016.1 hypothetical protein BC748_0624 [Flavobacterium dankookense]
MRNYDHNRVEFYSIEDMGAGHQLSKAEHILKNDLLQNYTDINDVIELYNIKKFFDCELRLNKWSDNEFIDFKNKVSTFGNIIGRFLSKINDDNIIVFYNDLLGGYISTFWELISNQGVYKKISAENFSYILTIDSHYIQSILIHKKLVEHFKAVIRSFLLDYSKSAEIILSIYEIKNEFRNKEMFLPKNLNNTDKENIIKKYLDSNCKNINYIEIIQNIRNRVDFFISDRIRLKAKRVFQEETDKIFKDRKDDSFLKFGVSVSFKRDAKTVKDTKMNDGKASFIYSFDYIKQNNDSYILFQNFRILFEYVDEQNRIELISKKNSLGVMERVIGLKSQNEYLISFGFKFSEMASHAHIVAYEQVLKNELGNTLENILQEIFTSFFHEKYNFASNSRILMPSKETTSFEKVRLLAPEFESVLKQYKLFIEDGFIDFELLQISSSPTSIKDIPSLNEKKYIYFNNENIEFLGCSNLFFSDQTMLAYVNPHKEKHYKCFFDLLANEDVNIKNYEDYQIHNINYLIDKKLINLDDYGYINITNFERVLILKDLYDNEVGAYYHYPDNFKNESENMAFESIVRFSSSLFSTPEQSYLNYFLNKSEFTNGLDLRNSYLHGTQANPEENHKHDFAYFTYLKLLVLVLLKIEDDLYIAQIENEFKRLNG